MPVRGGVVDVAGGDDGRGRGRAASPASDGVGRVGARSRARARPATSLEPEERGQPVERLGRRGLAAVRQRLPHRALAAAGEHHPVAAAPLAELVEVVDRAALLVAAQVRLGHRRGEPVVALDPARQHQQVAALGVGDAVLRAAQPERELGAEDGGQVVGGCGLGQHRGAVEAVVVGDRERVQPEPDGLLDQLGRRAGAVEEAEVAVAVQLGVGRDGAGRSIARGARGAALAPRDRGVVGAREPAEPALELLPVHGGVVPAHQVAPPLVARAVGDQS